MTAPEDQAPTAGAEEEGAPLRRADGFKLSYGPPKVVLLTTTSGGEEAVANLEHMLAGLRLQAESGAEIRSLLLVQQDEAATRALAERLAPPDFVEMIPAGGRMSLSAARNLMLARAAEQRIIAADDVVAFPDDDSWYPAGLLAKIQYLFACDPFFDFFFCRYGSAPEACHLSRCNEAPKTQTVVSNASSNTIFVRGRIANQIGGFDETLGVGAEHKAGEDLDYALRAYLAADQKAYLDAALVGHRDKDPAIRAKYFGGSLLVLSRYALASRAAMFALLRKLAIGLVFTLTGRLGPGALVHSVRVAFGQLGRRGGAR